MEQLNKTMVQKVYKIAFYPRFSIVQIVTGDLTNNKNMERL